MTDHVETWHTYSMFNLNHIAKILYVLFCLFSLQGLADPSQANTYKNRKSHCVVKTTAGEYPDTSVYIKNKKILGPLSWGLSFSRFSPSGSYIALTNSETEWFTDNEQHYKIAIVNCKNGKVKYYLNSMDITKKGRSSYYTWASITKWSKNDREIEYDDYYDYDKNRKEKLVFIKADK